MLSWVFKYLYALVVVKTPVWAFIGVVCEHCKQSFSWGTYVVKSPGIVEKSSCLICNLWSRRSCAIMIAICPSSCVAVRWNLLLILVFLFISVFALKYETLVADQSMNEGVTQVSSERAALRLLACCLMLFTFCFRIEASPPRLSFCFGSRCRYKTSSFQHLHRRNCAINVIPL
jgi:hypothetical protein